MNITQNNISDLNAVISIQLLPEDYKPVVTEELKKYARKASMPGFRPGKVPLNLVKKMVGLNMVIDTVSKTLQKELQGYIEENKLDLVGDPLPAEKHDESYFDINCEKELKFDFEVGLAPEFELNLDFKDPIGLFEVEIDDIYLNQQLDELRDRHADLIYPDDAAEGDIIFGKLIEVGEGIEEGEAFEKMIALNPKRIEAKNLFPPFYGKKLEDTLSFELSDLGDDEAAAKTLTMEPEEFAAIKDKKFEFVVKRISRLSLAAFTPEFFKKVFGETTDITDEAGFMEKYKGQLQKQLDTQAKFHQRGEVKRIIEETHDLALPEAFLKKWMMESNPDKVNDENIDQEYDNVSKSLKWSLIIERIQKDFPETKIEPDELTNEVKAKLRQNFDEDMTDEMEQQYVEYIMGNEHMLKDYYYRILDDKVFGVIGEKVTSKTEKITATAMFEKLEAERG